MIRTNGFINLDLLLIQRGVNITDIGTIKESPLVKDVFNSKKSLLIDLDGESYYFKTSRLSSPYNELIANELAKDFGIESVEYDLATLNNKKGVISKSFRKDNATYITGYQLLLDAGYDKLKSHNLETIWNAIEYRYRNHPNKNEIVEKLTNSVVSTFIFDMILFNTDRHFFNWEIEETKDNIKIVPIFDHEFMLSDDSINAYIPLTVDGESHGMRNNLELFINISEDKIADSIKDNLWIISAENLELIFRRIELKTEYPMPEEKKNYYLKRYNDHLNYLKSILIKDENILERDDLYEGKNR